MRFFRTVSAILLLQAFSSITAQQSTAADCTAPLVTGNCRALFMRWGSKGGKCEEFIYGGCGGNSNNFGTQDECQAACPTSPSPLTAEECAATLEIGRCRARIIRWGNQNGVCETFTYGGCGGNTNNFRTQNECQAACPPAVQPVPKPQPPILLTPEECAAPLVTGNCEAAITRWGNRNGICETFTYGGCGGNTNNFRTQNECQVACPTTTQPPSLLTPEECAAPLVTGNCRATITRWGNRNGICETFTYGGCGGNTNNFRTEAECRAGCPPGRPTSVCDLQLDAGPCRSNQKRWAFSNGKCRRFTYGGCEGNANKFSTKRACNKRCHPDAPKPRKCNNSREQAIPCAIGKLRWLYNKELNVCQRTVQRMCAPNGKTNFGFGKQRKCSKQCEDD